jgi:hypothetical protein
MRCSSAVPFLFTLLGNVSAKPLFLNSTITNAPSMPSGFPAYNVHNQTFASGITKAYYNTWNFPNPYFWLYTDATDDAVRSDLVSCSTSWDSLFHQWTDTAAVTLGPIVPETTITTVIAPWFEVQSPHTATYTGFLNTWIVTKSDFTSTHAPTTLTITSSAYGPLYYVEDHLDFTASEEPCCNKCTRYGGDVQVFFWPPETQSQSTSTQLHASAREVHTSPVSDYANTTRSQLAPSSTLIDEAGFTLYVFTPMQTYSLFLSHSSISPTIYVAFRSLSARNWCSNIGAKYDATTIGFEPGELSTSKGAWMSDQPFWAALKVGAEIVWTQATFGDR